MNSIKHYRVNFYKGNYRWRQQQANNDGCIGYVEHHFNSANTTKANYTLCIVGRNASNTSKRWGRYYSLQIRNKLGVDLGGNEGIVVGGFGGRGNTNLKYTHMPAILVEPLFGSTPTHAEYIRTDLGQYMLADALRKSIVQVFPKGGLIGFSVGHKYKTSRPSDRGATFYGGGYEADYSEIILTKCRDMLI